MSTTTITTEDAAAGAADIGAGTMEGGSVLWPSLLRTSLLLRSLLRSVLRTWPRLQQFRASRLLVSLTPPFEPWEIPKAQDSLVLKPPCVKVLFHYYTLTYMDKRSLIFVISLSLTLLGVNTFFQWINHGEVEKWHEQQKISLTTEANQLSAQISDQTARASDLPLVDLFC